ncbi:hypothetical protein HOY34_04795 [Xinfangfangia sp. D13-10-4-6]|uniref:I78 family peptidase inhibitor n=1 Tax=Pseudogemmobacter hezensis TaxID=2737662 RepID=UPI0015564B2D|nr:I78 family peptidase inhibitor [Pseudogemmobacter hezensis]NPD14518.1 hypothetical protein [Pseudogemmobacter hezensis]
MKTGSATTRPIPARLTIVGAALGLGLLLAACVQEVGLSYQPALPDQANDSCGANALAPLLGQDKSALRSLATRRDPTRVIGPNQAITMDLLPNRLNVMLDGNDKVVQLTCG